MIRPSDIPKVLEVAKNRLSKRDYYRFEYLMDLVEESSGVTRVFLEVKLLDYTNEILGH